MSTLNEGVFSREHSKQTIEKIETIVTFRIITDLFNKSRL